MDRMKPRVLIIVSADPRASHRPAEAVRIAAGVGVWQKADMALYLRGEAVLALGDPEEGLIDEENFNQCWPMLVEAGQRIYVQENAPALKKIVSARAPFMEISDDQLAALAAAQACVLHF